MSRENVETLRRGYEAFNRRNIDAWLHALDADVEAQDLPSIPDAPIRRGHAALREWVSMMDDIWWTDATSRRNSSRGPVRRGCRPCHGPWPGERYSDGCRDVPGLRETGRQSSTRTGLPRPGRGPASRRAVRVGDVAEGRLTP